MNDLPGQNLRASSKSFFVTRCSKKKSAWQAELQRTTRTSQNHFAARENLNAYFLADFPLKAFCCRCCLFVRVLVFSVLPLELVGSSASL